MSGSAYWIKTDDSENQGVTIATESLQQSVVRLGTTVGYRSDVLPITWTAKGAWAHRFGRSITMNGKTNNLTGEFKTEDFKESWGELALEYYDIHCGKFGFSSFFFHLLPPFFNPY